MGLGHGPNIESTRVPAPTPPHTRERITATAARSNAFSTPGPARGSRANTLRKTGRLHRSRCTTRMPPQGTSGSGRGTQRRGQARVYATHQSPASAQAQASPAGSAPGEQGRVAARRRREQQSMALFDGGGGLDPPIPACAHRASSQRRTPRPRSRRTRRELGWCRWNSAPAPRPAPKHSHHLPSARWPAPAG